MKPLIKILFFTFLFNSWNAYSGCSALRIKSIRCQLEKEDGVDTKVCWAPCDSRRIELSVYNAENDVATWINQFEQGATCEEMNLSVEEEGTKLVVQLIDGESGREISKSITCPGFYQYEEPSRGGVQ